MKERRGRCFGTRQFCREKPKKRRNVRCALTFIFGCFLLAYCSIAVFSSPPPPFSARFCGSLSHIHSSPSLPPSLPFTPPPPAPFPLSLLGIDRVAIRQAHALAEFPRVVIPEFTIEGRDALHVLLGKLKVKEGQILLMKREREGGRERRRDK